MKLGIFGGTFDPIHRGHLEIARQTLFTFELDQVLFVVADVPPHKHQEEITSAYHRFAMVALAIQDEPGMRLCTLELHHRELRYTVDTLREIRRRYGLEGTHLYYIAGGDSFQQIGSWRKYEELLSTYNLVFAARPGFSVQEGIAQLPEYLARRVRDWRHLKQTDLLRSEAQRDRETGSKIYLIEVGTYDISSTGIRQRIRAGKSIGDLVPSPVEKYIDQYLLYRNSEMENG
ncbi:MAG: nicotinate-nucleotide adenylyltransferase [Acidobacteria bacterium]|nr:nicotinate-nucleotide adenylyltransferase [Acidobacteriota bacterium]